MDNAGRSRAVELGDERPNLLGPPRRISAETSGRLRDGSFMANAWGERRPRHRWGSSPASSRSGTLDRNRGESVVGELRARGRRGRPPTVLPLATVKRGTERAPTGVRGREVPAKFLLAGGLIAGAPGEIRTHAPGSGGRRSIP